MHRIIHACDPSLARALSEAQDNDTIIVSGNHKGTPIPESGSAPDQGETHGAALCLRNVNNVTLRGEGWPIIRFDAEGNGLLIQNCSNLTVTGIEFRGTGKRERTAEPSDYYYALLLLDGYNPGLSVRNNRFLNSGNHGIAHLWGSRATEDSEFIGNYFVSGGNLNHPRLTADGAAIAVGGQKNRFVGNRIVDWLRGIELENPFTDIPTAHNRILDNYIERCNWQSILITATNLRSDLFHSNRIVGNHVVGSLEPEGAPNTLPFSECGIYCSGMVRSIIAENIIEKIKDGGGILLESDWGDILNVQIRNNIIREVGKTGLQVLTHPACKTEFLLRDCDLDGNTILNPGGRGIWFHGDRCRILDNRIVNSPFANLHVEAGGKNQVGRNFLSGGNPDLQIDDPASVIS